LLSESSRTYHWKGGGLTSTGGAAHNSIEDISITKSFVNMSVLSISDPNMIRDILFLSIDYEARCTYALAGEKNDRVLYERVACCIRIRQRSACPRREGHHYFRHGDMVAQALDAADKNTEG
jgi:transketolase